MATQTSQQETAVLSTGALMAAAGNTFEWPGSPCRTRDLSQPLPSQTSTNGTGLLTPPVAMAVDNFQGAPRGVDEPLPTQGGSETLGLLSAGVLPYRRHTTPTSHAGRPSRSALPRIPGLLTAAGTIKNNGSILEDCFFRMMRDHEIGRGCGFDVNLGAHQGTFQVWGSARDRVDGYGNAVSPQVGWWISGRLRAVLHNEEVAA